MSTNANLTNIAAEFFVAAEVAKRGHVPTITFGPTKALDLLVKNNTTGDVAKVEVKGLKGKNDWMLGKPPKNQAEAPTSYVLCFLGDIGDPPTYWIVPYQDLWKNLVPDPKGNYFARFDTFKNCGNKWDNLWG